MGGTGSMCERLRGGLDGMKKHQSGNFVVWTFGERCSICSRPAEQVYTK